MKNFLIYPFQTMRITQNYNGSTSHKPYSTGNPADYPIDEGGKDGGRDWFCSPCDEVYVARMTGVGTSYTNTVWLTSTSKVIFADGTVDFVTIECVHPNDDDLRRIKVGQKFKRKEKIFREGTDGHATGNHIHMSAGKGKLVGNGWKQNSKGKYVITTTDGSVKPENAFAVDKDFTKVVNKAGLKFKSLAMVEKEYEDKHKYTVGDYEVTVDLLHVRSGAGKAYLSKPFSKLTKSAQVKIEKLNHGKPADGYVKGLKFTCSEVKYNKKDELYWGKTPSGWVALNYCKKIK